MLPKEKKMEVLEAFDLTKSYRAAGQLTGVDHHTVARAVAARASWRERRQTRVRPTVADAFSDKIAEWIERSGGKVRADVVHDKLGGHGLRGLGAHHQAGGLCPQGRPPAHRTTASTSPGSPSPGMWLQYDFGAGPVIDGVEGDLVLRLAGLEPLPGDHPAG